MSEVVAIDTEFERRKTYRPILSIVQLKKNNDETIIYDVYRHKNKDLTDLIEILRNNNVVKIIHSARQDVEAIFYRFNIAMKNIFDTQLAYKYLKFNQKKNAEIGYSTLVKEFCNIDINKSKTLQKSNWLKRPLTEQQLKYAKLDVEYLYEIYLKMNNLFDKTGNDYKQFMAECRILENESNYTFNPKLFWHKISHKFRNYPNYHFIQKLFLLREKLAFKANIPREFVISHSDLINFAQTGNIQDLKTHFRIDKKPFLELYWQNNN